MANTKYNYIKYKHEIKTKELQCPESEIKENYNWK